MSRASELQLALDLICPITSHAWSWTARTANQTRAILIDHEWYDLLSPSNKNLTKPPKYCALIHFNHFDFILWILLSVLNTVIVIVFVSLQYFHMFLFLYLLFFCFVLQIIIVIILIFLSNSSQLIVHKKSSFIHSFHLHPRPHPGQITTLMKKKIEQCKHAITLTHTTNLIHLSRTFDTNYQTYNRKYFDFSLTLRWIPSAFINEICKQLKQLVKFNNTVNVQHFAFNLILSFCCLQRRDKWYK